jgi:NAD(P)-dependent dehydrogenase (short-subunit alcohol dehydrogenase family)
LTQSFVSLDNRTVVVTGASSGIGRGCAIVAAELGARVVLVGRDETRLRETESQLAGSGHLVAAYDLQKVDGIADWMKQFRELSGLVHAAGMQVTQPLRALTVEQHASVMRVNLDAALFLTKGFRQRGVLSTNGGSIVYIASVMAFAGKPAIPSYTASKGALVSMARSLAVELAREKIRVNCVAPALVPSGIADEMQKTMTPEQFGTIRKSHPLGFGTPRDVGNAVAFLLSDSSRWITGTTLVTDGGFLTRG